MRKSALWLSTALAWGLGQAACTAMQDTEMQTETITAEGADGDWTVYGGDLSNTRYVANDQINSGNVKGLHLKWIFQPGIIGSF
jgi:glucose dehydrogenase